jgi:Flp pilus assembly CpaF family ATPase
MSAIPFDMKTYFGLIRVVPAIDKLVEVQVYLPSKQFNDLKTLLKETGINDVEVSSDGNMIVRRGRTNKATNIFIVKE